MTLVDKFAHALLYAASSGELDPERLNIPVVSQLVGLQFMLTFRYLLFISQLTMGNVNATRVGALIGCENPPLHTSESLPKKWYIEPRYPMIRFKPC